MPADTRSIIAVPQRVLRPQPSRSVPVRGRRSPDWPSLPPESVLYELYERSFSKRLRHLRKLRILLG